MSQTILTALAAVHFVAITCYVNTNGFINVAFFKVYSIVLAFGLGCVAVGRYMGWPL